ncbi:MAG: carbohydrate ABC transporter permease [Candidatus Ventricola sp.]|nr:carbohydrate ABC transporter permease [Candidatus Ventricola sp.]
MKKKINWAGVILLTVASVVTLIPLWIMLCDSLKLGSELAMNSWGLPKAPTLRNYVDLVSYNSGIMVRTFANSLFVSVIYTVLTIVISCLAAFAFAKYRFKGRDLLFLILITTMMVPGELTMPAIFLMFSKVKMLNTYAIQIFPGIANTFCLFMLKQYIESLPDSLLEAARIDGAGHLYIFRKIVVPLVKPAIGALTILTFLGKWNDYLWPHTLLTKVEVMPIMVVLPTLNTSTSTYSIPWELVLAGCTVITLPLVIVFLIFQDQFMSSVTIGAVKE